MPGTKIDDVCQKMSRILVVIMLNLVPVKVSVLLNILHFRLVPKGTSSYSLRCRILLFRPYGEVFELNNVHKCIDVSVATLNTHMNPVQCVFSTSQTAGSDLTVQNLFQSWISRTTSR